ncbi:hypothetical protein OIV83_002864 [Microbotryomycetes sp. JL201]|nr:hypothetical protein OIV83_002864 [Microbotryomycetes sp. JL201]
MPTTRNIGTPGAANDKIGGVPEFHYYDFASKGRGEVIRLFFEDAGIAFVDVRYGFDEWNSKSVEERSQVNPAGTVPFVLLNGKVLAQSYALLRYFARQLGTYDGKDSEAMYFVDRITDITADWRSRFVDAHFEASPNGLNPADTPKAVKNHKEFLMPRFVRAIEKLLATSKYSKQGPYVIGADITCKSYADITLWQMYHDERELGGPVKDLIARECPTLQKLLNEFESRPQLKDYWSSDRYYN